MMVIKMMIIMMIIIMIIMTMETIVETTKTLEKKIMIMMKIAATQ